MQPGARSPIFKYGVAILAVFVALLARLALDPILHDRQPFCTFYLAVVVAAWLGGVRPALVALILGGLVGEWFFMSPRQASNFTTEPQAVVGAVTYMVVGVALGLLSEAIQRARQRGERQTREALRQANERLQSVLHSITDGYFVLDQEFRFIEINPAAHRMVFHDRPVDQLLGTSLWEVYPQAKDSEFAVQYRQAVRDQTPVHFEAQARIVDRWFETHAYPREGRLEVYLRDITERKKSDEQIRALNAALRQRAEELETVLNVLPVGLFIAEDPSCEVIRANPAGARMLGVSPQKNTSKSGPVAETLPFRVLRDGVEVPPDELPIQRAARLGITIRDEEFDIVRDDGVTLRLYECASPLFDENGQVRGCVGVFIDISERRRAEQALRESEAEFRAIFEMAASGKAQADALTGRYTRVNRRLCEITGYSEAELLEKTYSDITHPDDRERDRQMIARVLQGETDDWQIEKRYIRKDGREAWAVVSGHLLRDPEGRPLRTVATILDITDRKQAEEALKEADRRKNEFLATLAHELRNPLAPIRSAVQVMRLKSPPDPELQSARDVIDRQVRQMVRLIDDLLDASRITRNKLQLRKSRIRLADAVQSAVETARPVIEAARLQLAIDLPCEPVFLNADLTRLAQVFSNLLNNAAKYTDAGGRIELSARRIDGEAIVTVKDNGIGIPHSHLPKLFEMFSQVDPALERSQGGLGIGLALVRGLVEMHGGQVEARSEGPGRGSEFIVRLPALQDAAVDLLSPKEVAKAPAVQSAQRILVVDDNRDAAESLGMLLTLLGHQTRTAHDGLEAIQEAEVFRPDVVLLDIGLPKVNGYDAARHIREQPWGKDVSLIAVTGWGQDDDKRRASEAGFDHHLTKPVDPDTLERLLAQLSPTGAETAAASAED